MSDTIKDQQTGDLDKTSRNLSVFPHLTNLSSNSYHTFVVRKSERLASALYVITGFMPQEEPVRSRLRVCALELITRSSNPSELQETGRETFEARCSEIVAILQTAHHAGLISPMNAKLIGEEYGALASFVRTHSTKISERGHELKKSSVAEPRSVSTPIRHEQGGLLKENYESKRTTSKSYTSNSEYRRNVIIDTLNRKPEISIKDVMSFIPGVSGKTVQRDLLALVADGVLVKKGDRRWTTYSKSPSS